MMSSVESSLNQTLPTSTEAEQTHGGASVVVDEPTHWLLRVGNGRNFSNGQPFKLWGMDTKNKGCVPNFLREVRPGDKLWFVQSESKGKVVGVATFVRHCPRELGPLVAVSRTNDDLKWTGYEGDTEVHYTDLYDVSACDIMTKIKSPLVVRKLIAEKCAVNLPEMYRYLLMFSAARRIA
jgi:hypothetical protein